jgi:hypothetical protein
VKRQSDDRDARLAEQRREHLRIVPPEDLCRPGGSVQELSPACSTKGVAP